MRLSSSVSAKGNFVLWMSILFISILLEILCFLDLPLKIDGIDGNALKYILPILFTLFSVIIGISSFKIIRLITKKKNVFPSYTFPIIINIIINILIIILGIILIKDLNSLFISNPIDYDNPSVLGSDVINNAMSYPNRLVNGEFPYQPITGKHWGYILMPTYLTMMWLPYILPVLMGFDPRWIPIVAMVIPFLFFYYTILKSKINFIHVIGIFISILIWYLWLKNCEGEVKSTIEGLVVGYYGILGIALYKKSFKWILIAVILCLLSRFSLLFWIPLLLVTIYSLKGISKAIQFTVFSVIAYFALYGVFMLIDPDIFTNSMNYYTKASKDEWTTAQWIIDQGGKYPYHINKGLGWAIYFYDFIPGALEKKIEYLKYTQIIISIIIAIILSIVYWIYRYKINGFWYALIALKIYLGIFYAFIQIPYHYLFMVIIIINLPLMLVIFSNKNHRTSSTLR